MGVPNTIRVPVDSGYVLPKGAMFVSVEAATDFELRGKVDDAQARDKETGLRLWVVRVIDMDQVNQPDGPGFSRSAELKVRVVSPHRPVPPSPQVAGYGALIEFEGLTLTPYADSSKCLGPRLGREHRCGARQAYSLRATGIREFTGVPEHS